MKYPIDIHSFVEIREKGYPYVDKTDIMYKYLIDDSYSFMSIGRPDGFGKSLLLSTIKAFYEGRRELFNGLAIEKLNPKWVERSVFLFELGNEEYKTPEDLERVLDEQLAQYEKVYDITPDYKEPSFRIQHLIKAGYKKTGHGSVVLVDDYDKPILDTLETEEEDKVRSLLKSFLMCFKCSQPYIQSGIIAGKSRLGKLSIFSDINNISDLSTWRELDTLCGFTSQEINDNFADDLSEFAQSIGVSNVKMMEKICESYDGYRFTERPTKVMNPYSILRALANKRLEDYWFKAANQEHLVQLMIQKNYDLAKLIGRWYDLDDLYKCEAICITPMLYQEGFLTIKDYEESGWSESFTLDFPNKEVGKNFLYLLLAYYTQVTSENIHSEISHLAEEIEKGDIDAFMTRLQTVFFPTPYYPNKEHQNNPEEYYSPYQWQRIQETPLHNLLYLLSRFIGQHVKAKLHVRYERTCLAIWTRHSIYVMEFITDCTPEKALEVVHKEGFKSFLDTGESNVKLVGVNYSSSERNITGWKVDSEEYLPQS